ncbi:MAG: PKD domain-containing protein [Patescibacteria group bacterium]
MIVLLFAVFFLFRPAAAAAAATLTSGDLVPSDSSTFAAYFEITGESPNAVYEIKPEIEKAGSTSKSGYTWNPQASNWIKYSAEYAKHQSVVLDSDGNWRGYIFIKTVLNEPSVLFLDAILRVRYREKKLPVPSAKTVQKNISMIPAENLAHVKGIASDSSNFPLSEKPIAIFDGITGAILGLNVTENNSVDEGNFSTRLGFFNLAVPSGREISMKVYENIEALLAGMVPLWESGSLNLSTGEIINISGNSPPAAQIDIEKNTLFIEENNLFSSSDSFDEDNDLLSFLWDFGDGVSANGGEVEHAYGKEGNYSVILKVCDYQNCATSTIKLTVNNYYEKIILSEILANPEGGDDNDKWIEIENKANFDIPFNGWKISDRSGQKKYLDEYVLPANGIFVIYGASFLNKTTDEMVSLYYPNGSVADSAEYRGAFKTGTAWARGPADAWQWTSTPTPGSKNIISTIVVVLINDETDEDDQLEIISTAQAKVFSEKRVLISGKVTVLPGILSSQYFYIEDGTGGIQVYSYAKNFPPDLAEGDTVTVDGIISEINGEKRLKTDSFSEIKIVSKGQPLPPKETVISDIGTGLEGTYISVSGTISSTSGDTFYLGDNDENEIKVIIRQSTGIDKPKMRKGDRFTIAGILSTYKDEFRILPFKQGDVKPFSGDELPKAGPELFYYLLIGLGIFLVYLKIISHNAQNISRSHKCYLFQTPQGSGAFEITVPELPCNLPHSLFRDAPK